jgi:uncharacterized protein YcbK (DUF882 family)
MTTEWFKQTDFFQNYSSENWGDYRFIKIPLVFWLDEMRALAGKPIHINCAYGSKGHNPKGYHPLGMAADIHIKGMSVVDQLLLALKFPFNGVGVYPFWRNKGLHLDVRPFDKYKRVWYRDAGGRYHNLTSIKQIMKEHIK